MRDVTGVIADIVGSRELTERPEVQHVIHAAFDRAHRWVQPLHPAWATVGDEFQSVYRTWEDALRATTRVILNLPDHIQLRFGIGTGEVREIEKGPSGPIHDGSAWLHARAAIDETTRRQQHVTELGSWFSSDDDGLSAAVNAHLLTRDHILGRMKARERRLCALALEERTQKESAAAERITQSAVSQSLHRSGTMALLSADQLLADSSGRSANQ